MFDTICKNIIELEGKVQLDIIKKMYLGTIIEDKDDTRKNELFYMMQDVLTKKVIVK